MSIFVLSKHSMVHEEIVNFEQADPANPIHVDEGTWIKMGSNYKAFTAMDATEVGDVTCAVTINDSLRGDNGKYSSANPAYVKLSEHSTVTVLRLWDNTLVSTDDIVDAGSLTVGAELTVIGGKLAARTDTTTQPLFGIYLGPDIEQKVENGHVVKLMAKTV